MERDPVSKDLRAAERQIDTAYRCNPLFKMTFGEAAWYFLAQCEEVSIRQVWQISRGADEVSPNEGAAIADHVMNMAKWPLRWLHKECEQGDVIPIGYSDDPYEAARDLSELASRYLAFESAFTYASLGLLELQLDGDRIVASGPLRDDTRFDAYDRLMDLLDKEGGSIAPSILPLQRTLSRSVRVKGDKFFYPLNPRLVKQTSQDLDASLNERFTSPGHWQLGNYSMDEFCQTMKVLWVLSAIHFFARITAANLGCVGLGYDQALVLMTPDELARRLTRYTRLEPSRIQAILGDLTYGANQLHSPDPALQPLIPLTSNVIGWAPSLILNSSMDRNLIVLLNRTPDTREAYSKLSGEKEGRLRSRIQSGLKDLQLRFWNGTLGALEPALDIDLALISDTQRYCLILELKSFIAPAEPREIRDRSEEIARGIEQVLERKRLFGVTPTAFTERLEVDSDYGFEWALVSENSIGGAWVQHDSVPVIRATQFIQKLVELKSLPDFAHWLNDRSYLPTLGLDYEVIETDESIGGYVLSWFAIKGLNLSEFSGDSIT